MSINTDVDEGLNPADFGILCELIGSRAHLRKSRASLSWTDAPAFMARLREVRFMSARVLEWIILTGVRSSEAIGARWGEIDWRARTWTVPVERLKTEQSKGEHGKAFVVPLSLAMVQLLRRTAINREDFKPGDLIFPSDYTGRAYRRNMILIAAQKLNPEISVHGFRSTLTAWGSGTKHRDREPFGLDVMDRVLGHMIGSEEGKQKGLSPSLRAYAHDAGGDLYLPRRVSVMREWSAFLSGRPYSAQDQAEARAWAVAYRKTPEAAEFRKRLAARPFRLAA